MPPFEVELPNRRSTKHLARSLARALRPSDLVVLSGALGAGKTFFVRAVLRTLGLAESDAVTSPTFALVNEYVLGPLEVWHADLYRLGDESELGPLGLGDARARGAVLLVEWGAPYAAALGNDHASIALELGPLGRRARIEGAGARGAQLVTELAAQGPHATVRDRRRRGSLP
ncbi:MAG: tRNA (adenosine(37)-N6)-threonylcarbamoyltransferase complex ATPase subunit type 1 TsaE [Polyangiaceae bacterium]